MNILITITLIIVVVAAASIDVRKRKIPNWVTLPSAMTGVLLNFSFFGFRGLLSAIFGILAGFFLLFFVYLMGGMGAGDVKLMAVIGAFLGPWLVFVAFIWMALAGGILALCLILWRRAFRQTFQNIKTILLTLFLRTSPRQTQITIENPKLIKLPYGVPIATGTILAVWLKDIPRINFWQ